MCFVKKQTENRRLIWWRRRYPPLRIHSCSQADPSAAVNKDWTDSALNFTLCMYLSICNSFSFLGCSPQAPKVKVGIFTKFCQQWRLWTPMFVPSAIGGVLDYQLLCLTTFASAPYLRFLHSTFELTNTSREKKKSLKNQIQNFSLLFYSESWLCKSLNPW